jgi:hypothetical protein
MKKDCPAGSGAVLLAMRDGSGLALGLVDADGVGDAADDVGDSGRIADACRISGTESAAGHRDLIAAAERVRETEGVVADRGTVVGPAP